MLDKPSTAQDQSEATVGLSQGRHDRDMPLNAFMLFDANLDCTSIALTGPKLLDLPEDIMLGKNIVDIAPDVVSNGRYEKYLEVIRSGEPLVADDLVTTSEFGKMHFSVKAFKVGEGLGIVSSDITEASKVEERLRETKAAFCELLESLRDVVLEVSTEGLFTSLNPAFETVLGWPRAEWIGKSFQTLVHPDDLPLAMENFRRLLDGEKPPPYELRVQCSEGSCLTMELMMAPHIDGGRVIGALGVVRDVTVRKRSEEEVKVRDKAIESSINAIAIADMEGQLQYVNHSFLRMWGCDRRSEVLGGSLLDFWRDRNRAAAAVRKVVRRGSWRGELTAVGKDGSTFDVQLAANIAKNDRDEPICMIASVVDVTERNEAESALRNSERYYRSLIENALDGVVILDPDGKFRYESPSMERLLGLKPEERVGKDYFEFIHPDDLAIAAEAFSHLMKQPGATVHAEVRGLHSDGAWRTLEVIGRNLVDDPEVQGIVANFRDITERKKADEALRESETKLRRLVEDMNDGYCVLQRSKVVFANGRIAQMFGYSPDEVIGRTIDEMLPLEVVQDLARIRARRRRGDTVPVQYEVTLVGKDGQISQVELSTRITTWEGQQALSVLVRDISERKKAEEELRDSKEHYSALVENLADGVFQFKEGVITWCNSNVENIYGYSRSELVGMEASGFFPEDEDPSEYTRRVSTAIRHNGVFRDTRSIQDRYGATKYVEYSVSQIPDRDPGELVAIVRDITDRKRMEEALRESEEQYSALVSNIADAVFSYRDGKMMWINDTIEQMLGYTQEEIIGLDANLFVSDDTDLTEVASEVGTGIKQKGHFHGITRAKRKDGTVIDIEFTASRLPGKFPPEIVGVARDVTERKTMEKALKESEEHYRLLFESRLDGVFVIDAENLSVMLANQVVAEMYGFESTEEVIGLNPLDFVHPDDKDRALNSIVKDMFEDEKNESDEFRSITRDGREIWISTVGTKMEYAGRIAGLVSIRDITNQKRAEMEKQDLEQQLQLTGRLAAVGELAAGVAHELNNPLAAVQAFAQLLSGKEDLDQTTKGDVKTIYMEAQRATRITGNLLSFARRHKPEKWLVDINDVLEKSIELHAYRMKVNNIELVMDLDRDLPKTMADFHQMQQVFVNIITNAEQAMTEAHRRGRLCATTRRSGKMIQVRFADDGPGMPEEGLRRVFDPFYTTKEVGKGTGLGLSICYGIVQEHGGNLTATSKLGEGATFTVEIPIVTEARRTREKDSVRAKEV